MSIIKKSNYNVSPSIITILTSDNKRYSTYKRVVVSRSIDYVCGEFSITISRPAGETTPFKTGDTIKIITDNDDLMTGKIYSIAVEGDSQNDVIILSGRDITGDLIDSTVPDEAKVYVGGVKIDDIARAIITAKDMQNDISVIVQFNREFNREWATIKPFDTEELVTCATGDTVIEFLQKLCRKRQLFLNTTPQGNLLFLKAKGYPTRNKIVNQFKNDNNNVVSYRAKFGTADRYFKYICKTQSVGWVNDNSDVDSQGEALDVDISRFRTLEFPLEEGSSGSDECRLRAVEEANVRRARSFEYTPTLAGFRDKQLWAVGQFIDVVDDRAGVKGTFLIKAVEFAIDNMKGATTKLTIVDKDAFTSQASLSLRDRSESSKLWVNETDAKEELQIRLKDTLQILLEDSSE